MHIHNKLGARSFVAYEDIRIRPSSPLARELMQGTLDDFFEESLNDVMIHTDQEGVIADPCEVGAPNDSPREDSESSGDGIEIPGHSESGDDPQGRTDYSLAEISPALSAGLFDNHAFAMEDNELPRNPVVEAAARDIGEYASQVTKAEESSGKTLTSNKQAVLRTIKNRLGAKQVTAAQLSSAPAWILEETIQTESDDKWRSAYELVGYESPPADVNITAYQVVFKVKEDQDRSLRLKAKLVLPGNRDKDRFSRR